MEGFLSTVPPYGVCAPPARGTGCRGKRDGRFMTPQGLNYLELCRAFLAQVHPGAAPAHRRASTRECGVQVNAKVDKVVQCSLGPKTLLGPDEGDRPEGPHPTGPGGRSPAGGVRFPRPVSIYSPVFDRRVFVKKLCYDEHRDHDDGGGGSEGEAEQVESDKDAEADHSSEDTGKDPKTTSRQPSGGPNFQFLEQRYGFFHCKKCNIRWESAYVWCISGTSKVYYKQLCRKCQVGFNPYRVEAILCKGCSETCCSCERKQRHINMKRPHRQDLCCRCKGMRLSCDATYSFKYIV
ncbi:putative zygote arrest protein 1-like [Scophthalmus maximus]|uniref:Putative zygote arrest protein 1-like n=1 Tax=Scophthalmus maximus TaxID=52904 RepID=A0A2U9B7I6_SCOMX|nr:ZAR1-like protein isoform X1 [Scophthalmus maximus]AWO99930.1 putative zygote arrest protein 1-like [Scophthalmus maximus]